MSNNMTMVKMTMTNGGLWQTGWIWMSLTEKNVSGVPLIAFTAVSYVCASCLSLGACSCSSHVEGWQLLPFSCLDQWCRAGSAGERYGRKIGPGQRCELDLAGLINVNGNGRCWKSIFRKQGDSSGSEWLPWQLCWVTPFPLHHSHWSHW